MEKFSKLMENTFKLRENGTTVKTEIIAGVTTFMTMAYILAVNPNILSSTGMDHGAVFTATALAAFLGTLLMALFANYPFALAPGMGLNAYFAYTVVLGYGYSWQAALTAVFAEGIIFIVLSLTNVREAIFNSIPVSLKSAVSVGIGLFIAFIGLQNAKIVLPNSSTVAGLYSLSSYNANLQSAATLNGTEYVAGTFNDVGITVLLAVIGVILTAVLVVRNVKGKHPLGNSCNLDPRHDLPGMRSLRSEPGKRLLQPVPGFFQRTFHSKPCPDFRKTGFLHSENRRVLRDHVCIPVCRYV